MPLPARPFMLLRHGQSTANVKDLLAGGGIDAPLSPLGEEQARSLRDVFNQVAPLPDLIIHSDMKRSRRTAEIVNEKTNIPIYGDNDLREHMFGDWEGRPWVDVKEQIMAGEQPEGGECGYDFAHRVYTNMQKAFNKHPDDLIMFVGHGGTFYSILKMYGLNPVTEIKNCHLHLFEPLKGQEPMPWRVTAFDIENGKLIKRSADFCPTANAEDYFNKLDRRLSRKGQWVPAPK